MPDTFGHPQSYLPRQKAAREPWIAYILLILLGWLGLHKFYLEAPVLGVAYLIWGGLAFLLTPVFIGYIMFVPMILVLFFDLFWIPVRISQLNQNMLVS